MCWYSSRIGKQFLLQRAHTHNPAVISESCDLSAMGSAEIVKTHKDQGNEYFKAEMWLKAAACYTKGIKDNTDDAVLYRQARAR